MNGTLTARLDYDPSGRLDTAQPQAEQVTFAGLRRAGTDIELGVYRAYDSSIGRWLIEDPIKLLGGPNLYAYSDNTLTGLRDPLGLLTAAGALAH